MLADNGQVHRAELRVAEAREHWALTAPVERIGTPGMGVIVVGCKSPVRDRKSQGGQYTKWILRSTKYEAKATAGGRPTVGRKPAIVCVSAGSV